MQAAAQAGVEEVMAPGKLSMMVSAHRSGFSCSSICQWSVISIAVTAGSAYARKRKGSHRPAAYGRLAASCRQLVRLKRCAGASHWATSSLRSPGLRLRLWTEYGH